jgi:hypothetical protein
MKRMAVCAVFLMVLAMTGVASAEKCGWDVHYTSQFDNFELSKGHSLLFYTGQATIIMDDLKDPRHLSSGVCRGMGTSEGDKLNWSGACWWADGQGDRWVAVWGVDTPPAANEPTKGWYRISGQDNTGKFANLKENGSWTGLPKGGSRFCSE